MTEKEYQIIQGRICPYCGASTEYVDSSCVYNQSFGMIYLCRPCVAWVGVHKGTDIALGRLANASLRRLKKEAHEYFNRLFMDQLINKIWPDYIPKTTNRNKSYMWLSIKMNIPKEFCHIGMFNDEQCRQVIAICKAAFETYEDKAK